MPPPLNHPLWTAVTKSVAPTPITIHTAPTPVARVAHLEPRSDADVQRFIDAAKGNTLIKPKLVQDPNNDIWLEHLPQHIEVRATTAEDIEAREHEAVLANIVGEPDRRGDIHERKLTEISKDSSLQRHNIKRDNHNNGLETLPCSDPKRASEAKFQWSKYEPTDAEKDAIVKQAEAYVAFVQGTGTEKEIAYANHNAMAMAAVSQAREKVLRCKEDLAKASQFIHKQMIAVILLAVFVGVGFCCGLVGLLVELRRRSKKRARERAEGRVIELQVRAGNANGEEAK
jgi:hypothetical protein